MEGCANVLQDLSETTNFLYQGAYGKNSEADVDRQIDELKQEQTQTYETYRQEFTGKEIKKYYPKSYMSEIGTLLALDETYKTNLLKKNGKVIQAYKKATKDKK